MNRETFSSFPLHWPAGWQRAKFTTVAKFFTKSGDGRVKPKTMTEALSALQGELDRLGVSADYVLSTNVKVRSDGLPYANQAAPADPGVACYFTLNKKRVALACDKWRRVEDNIYAIAKHIEALRGQARWGVRSMERAFTGYAALPEQPMKPGWWQVLGVERNARAETIKAAFRTKAKTTHPDGGGSPAEFHAVGEAYELAKVERPEIGR